MTQPLQIENATVYLPDRVIERGFVRVADGRIAAVDEGNAPDAAGATVIDGRGQHLVPGFIDLQLNGGFGMDFTAEPATIWSVARQLPQFGVTSFLPTIITSPLPTASAAIAALRHQPDDFIGATPLGLHLEGPFLNAKKKGAHDAAYLLPPADAPDDWSADNGVRLVTIAPELPGATSLVRTLTRRGVVVSAGHSAASYAEARGGFNAGIRYGTHLFNAMSGLHHREPGLVGALLDDERVTVGLIADGEHVDPAVVRLVWRLIGRRVSLVSDAMAAMGMTTGVYRLGESAVTVDATTARLADGTLAGAVAPLDAMVRNLIRFTGCSLAEALPSVTTVAAGLLNLPQKGRIALGFDADLVLLDDDFQVRQTVVAGTAVYADAPE